MHRAVADDVAAVDVAAVDAAKGLPTRHAVVRGAAVRRMTVQLRRCRSQTLTLVIRAAYPSTCAVSVVDRHNPRAHLDAHWVLDRHASQTKLLDHSEMGRVAPTYLRARRASRSHQTSQRSSDHNFRRLVGRQIAHQH